MRDPKRIPRIIPKLQQIWEQHPDLRLCQLLSALAAIKNETGDLFYVEDDLIENAISEWPETAKRD